MNSIFASLMWLNLVGSLLILIMLLAQKLLRHKLPAAWLYYLWLIVLLRFLLPLPSPLNLAELNPAAFLPIPPTAEEQAVIPTPAVVGKSDSSPESLLPTEQLEDSGLLTRGVNGLFYLQTIPDITELLQTAASPLSPQFSVGECIVIIWLLGCAFFLARDLRRYIFFQRLLHCNRQPVHQPEIVELYRQTGGQLKLKNLPALYHSDAIHVPMQVGLLSPALLLPSEIMSASNPDLRYFLLHELTHFRRRDVWYKWLVQLCHWLYWFNPLLYVMKREISDLCELSCDAVVLSRLNPAERSSYGDMLLKAMASASGSKAPLSYVGATWSNEAKSVKLRFQHIINPPQAKKTLLVCFSVFALLLCMCAVLGGPTLSAKAQEQPTPEGEQKRVLTVSALWVLPPMQAAIERCQAAHPEIEVVVHEFGNYMDADSLGEDYDKYRQQISAQLMSGEFDVVLMPQNFATVKMYENGLLADFYPLMQNDPHFNEADYYMNVLDGAAYQGKLMVFPISFYYPIIGVNNLFSDELAQRYSQYETATYRQVLDLRNELTDKSGRYMGANIDVTSAMNNFNTYVDWEHKTCDFNNAEFIRFITDLKNGTLPEEKLEWVGNPDFGLAEQEAAAQQYLFRLADSTRFSFSAFFPYVEGEVFTHYIPLVYENGNLMMVPMDNCCISEASPNRDLAWEFVKFLTLPETNRDLRTFQFPVHRGAYQDRVPDELAIALENRRLVDAVDGETEKIVAQVMAYFARYNEMPMEAAIPLPDEVGEIFFEVITSFHNGTITAEQAAAAIQSKVSLYLME